jgi:hypothetical protein
MTARTRSLTWTLIAAAIVAAAIVSAAHGRELRSTGSETGESRDLVNRPDCWTGGAARAFGRCAIQ